MIKVGILTSGGDCQGLNGAMYGLVKGLTETNKDKVEIYGILDGYTGLINGDYKKMKPEEFENILNLGGSILGNSRQPFKKINEPDEKGRNKVEAMISNYKKMELDCLVVLGGNGSHKTANLLSEKGLNIVTLPKTIDNDINGTDMTFGFQSAIDIATRTLDELHTTAKSHGRIMIAEIMGNKAGWLTLYSGIAGKADVILIPEIPYNIEKISQYIKISLKMAESILFLQWQKGLFHRKRQSFQRKNLSRKEQKTDIFQQATVWRLNLVKKLTAKLELLYRAIFKEVVILVLLIEFLLQESVLKVQNWSLISNMEEWWPYKATILQVCH